jgi:hypothetical protein
MSVTQINGRMVDSNGEVLDLESMTDADVYGEALKGTEEQLSFELSSEHALQESTLKLSAVPPLAVDGQYKEGDRVRVVLEVVVEHVAFPPIKARGFRVGTERRHHAQVVSARPLTDDE